MALTFVANFWVDATNHDEVECGYGSNPDCSLVNITWADGTLLDTSIIQPLAPNPPVKYAYIGDFNSTGLAYVKSTSSFEGTSYAYNYGGLCQKC